MNNVNEYFCPPRLNTQYRIIVWDMYSLLIGVVIIAVGALWVGSAVVTLGVFYLMLTMYIRPDKSIYMILKIIVLYFIEPQSFSQIKEIERKKQ